MKIIEVEIIREERYIYRMIWHLDNVLPTDNEILQAFNSTTQYPTAPGSTIVNRLGVYDCQKK